MKRVLVQYRVKADKAAENEDFIKKVFAELKQTGPEGLQYASFKLEDGVSFVHIASHAENNPLSESAAFKAFQAEIKERCEAPPVAVTLNEVGSYRFFEN